MLRPVSSAPRWAAPSIPNASPLVMVRPQPERREARARVVSIPWGVGLRLPTMASCGSDSNAGSPRRYRTGGASGISARS